MAAHIYLTGISLSKSQEDASRAIAVQQCLAAKTPGTELTIISPTPQADRPLAKEWGFGFVPLSPLRLLVWTLKTGACVVGKHLGFRSEWLLPDALRHLAQAQAVIQLRGLLDAKDSLQLSHLLLLTLVETLGKSPLILSQGTLPPSLFRRWAKRVLKRAHVVVCRGPEAMAQMERLLPGRFIPKRQDVSFALEPKEQLAHRILPPRFFHEGYVCVAPFGTPGQFQDFVSWLAEARALNVCLVASHRDERRTCTKVLAALHHHSRLRLLSHPVCPAGFKGVVSGAQLAVVERGNLWNQCVSVALPTLAVGPSRRLRDRIGEMGMANWVAYEEEHIASKFEELERKRTCIVQHLLQSQGMHIQSAENNLEWALDDSRRWSQRRFLQSSFTWEEA